MQRRYCQTRTFKVYLSYRIAKIFCLQMGEMERNERGVIEVEWYKVRLLELALAGEKKNLNQFITHGNGNNDIIS